MPFSKDQAEENVYQDRWILEMLEHKVTPIVKKLKKDIEDLEKSVTQMILDERKKTRTVTHN